MLGNMMKRHLNTSEILKFAEEIHGECCVVGATVDFCDLEWYFIGCHALVCWFLLD